MRTISKPTKNKPHGKTIESDAPSHIQIPEDSYALMFHKDGQVEIVAPHGSELSNGHVLLLGIVNLLKTDSWADNLIEQTAMDLKEPYTK